MLRFETRPSLIIGCYINSVPFTREVIEGRASLGGSESAAIALMRGLAARGHDVHVFATKLADDCKGAVIDGVSWVSAEDCLQDAFRWMRMDVFISLRMPQIFALRSTAKLNILWGQDMLVEPISSWCSPVDQIAYVSRWQQTQWAEVDPNLARVPSFVTTNAYDPTLVPPRRQMGRAESPRFIHISRPERGLKALMAIWPKIRSRWPLATLRLCRYSSMYDAGGWGRICAEYDAYVAGVNAQVGGITYLGELGKPALYRELAASDLFIYPSSQPGFGETNCLAVTEAQACGVPVLASYRGALPETLAPGAGRLIVGEPDAWHDPAWLDEWVEAAALLLEPEAQAHCSAAGRVHAARATLDRVAAQWEQQISETFESRYARDSAAIVHTLLREDNHVLAKFCLDRGDGGETATADLGRCETVIRGEGQSAEDYGAHALQDPIAESEANPRFEEILGLIASRVPDGQALRVLDVSCGNGAMLRRIAKAYPEAALTGVDYSSHVIDLATRAVPTAELRCGDWRETLPALASEGRSFDLIFCGEFLEHVEHPEDLIAAMEAVAAPGATMALTTPCGPWTDLMPHGQPILRGHVHAYDVLDIGRLFGAKRDALWRYLDVGVTKRGDPVGVWLIVYRADAAPETASRTLHDQAYQARKVLTERPDTVIHASLLMRDNEDTVLRCLHSLHGVVDRIVIYDTGSTDRSIELAETFGADVIRGDWPEDFSVARNRSLAAAAPGADFVLWIDTDEWLDGGHNLRQFTVKSSLFHAFALRQHHFHVDKPNEFDKPCRVFRTGAGIQFYGVCHEQPEQELDKSILPALLLDTTRILHTGYATAETRVTKMRARNLALLRKEIDGGGTHPPRRLAWLLLMRDYVNFSGLDMAERRSEDVSPQGRQWLAQAVAIYRHFFADPDDPLHELAFGFYQDALRLSTSGIQIAWSFAATRGTLTRQPGREVLRVLTPEEGEALVARRTARWMAQLKPRAVPCPDPVVSSDRDPSRMLREVAHAAAG
jgi:2-polyprenyl-3-methyl-5-hydroxy-6-metoxy-1,4-benzoquinol methylase/glycosyltransferase involved in cell wall biosynthesis